jgi:hypothetical protein
LVLANTSVSSLLSSYLLSLPYQLHQHKGMYPAHPASSLFTKPALHNYIEPISFVRHLINHR